MRSGQGSRRASAPEIGSPTPKRTLLDGNTELELNHKVDVELAFICEVVSELSRPSCQYNRHGT